MTLLHYSMLRGGAPVAGGSAPAAPSSLTATAVSSSQINLAWTDNSGDETGFEVERSADGSTGWTNITTTAANATSYSNTGLTASTLYYYRVRAVNSFGNSSYTSNASDTTDAAGSFPDPTLWRDTFEGGNLSASAAVPGNINNTGFDWTAENYTSVVYMDGGVATRSYPTPEVTYPGKDYTAYEGEYSLRFRYHSDTSFGMAEQYFAIGTNVMDLWVRYWIRVPPNFSHGGMNNKFAAFWTVTYDQAGTVTWQTRPTTGGSCKLVVQDGGTGVGEVDAYENFITVPTDQGRWMQVVIRMRPESTSGAEDGIITFWRRWDGESSFTQLYTKTNAQFYQGGVGIHEGYLMGSAEGGPYSEETEWLLDDFCGSDESLV